MLDRAREAARRCGEMQALDRSAATVAFAMDGTILRANANFLRLFGYEREDIIGLNHAMFVPPEDVADESEDALWAALQKGEFQDAEFRRIRKDGAAIWIRATYTPAVDEGGQPFEVVKIAADVTADKLHAADQGGQTAAINNSQAVLHLSLDGTILAANDLFLQTMGYARDEVKGRPHRMFLDRATADSAEFATLWDNLGQGLPQSGEFKCLGKDGLEVWLKAAYTPILDMDGCPFKVVAYASDTTRERLRQADHEGQIAAIHKSQGVITFDMGGTILDANDHFLAAVGYRLEEIEGRHHRMFVDPSYSHGSEYATFWDNLAAGRHQAGEYKRIGKNGREVWLQATYNPVLDLNRRPFKIVKYAIDITREKLRQAYYQGQIAAIHKAQCVITFDLDGIILDANDNFLNVTGYRLAEIRGRHHRLFVEPALADGSAYEQFWRDLGQGRHQSAEYKRLCKDGREIWLQATYNPILDMNGRPFKVVKYATDITAEKRRQADHEGQIAAIRTSQCVVSFDMTGHVLDANDNFLAAMGYRLDEIKGHHHRMFVEPGFADTNHYAEFWATLNRGTFLSAKLKRIGKGGREVWIQASYNPIFDLNGQPFKVLKIFTDITADVRREAALRTAEQRVQHDATTSLPNRIRLAAFMSEVLADPQVRLAVLYLDLDHFKPINDTYGHNVGDHVLCETADRLRRTLAPGQIVARVGGDEFVVAAPHLSDQAIESLCRQLISIVTAPIHHERRILNVGLSIGVAVSPTDGRVPEDLLRCADVALYRSKGNGRGSYSFFAQDTDERIAASRNLAEEMRHGIKAAQFSLDFQPRINARTRAVDGIGALVRWMHPERGRLLPAEFMALAEKSGLVVPLGEWALRAACLAALAWPEVAIAVKVSSVQLRSSDLVALVVAVLSETGLDPRRLELEINDDVLADEETPAILEGLKATGVRLVLDEGGTSHLPLDRLRSLPLDFIKFDRSFLAALDGQEGGRVIAQAVLGVGKVLRLHATSGDTETAGHLLRLCLDGGTEVQGFLLASPLSSSAVSTLLKQDEDALVADA